LTGPVDVGDELGPGDAVAVPAEVLADPEVGEVVDADLDAFPEDGAVQEVSRRIDAAKAVAISRGERPCSRGTRNQSEWKDSWARSDLCRERSVPEQS
jgi:hypothetical protein